MGGSVPSADFFRAIADPTRRALLDLWCGKKIVAYLSSKHIYGYGCETQTTHF
jgi:hypothetical protein